MILPTEWESLANQISVYLTTSLPDCAGRTWQAPSLLTLASFWYDHCSEFEKSYGKSLRLTAVMAADVRQAARGAFLSTVRRFGVKEASDVVESWREKRERCVQPCPPWRD